MLGGTCADTHALTRACMHACTDMHPTRLWCSSRPAPASFHGTCRCRRPAPGTGRAGTHLQVPVDDPHLVAMENRLQDLLDAVTVADSTCISAVACGGAAAGAGWHGGGSPAGRSPWEAENQGVVCHMGTDIGRRRPSSQVSIGMARPRGLAFSLPGPPSDTHGEHPAPRGPRWPRLTLRWAGGWRGREGPRRKCQAGWAVAAPSRSQARAHVTTLSVHSGRRLPTRQLSSPGGGQPGRPGCGWPEGDTWAAPKHLRIVLHSIHCT